jgi:hypothetical protein
MVLHGATTILGYSGSCSFVGSAGLVALLGCYAVKLLLVVDGVLVVQGGLVHTHACPANYQQLCVRFWTCKPRLKNHWHDTTAAAAAAGTAEAHYLLIITRFSALGLRFFCIVMNYKGTVRVHRPRVENMS